MKIQHLKAKPPYVLASGFGVIIVIGTLLLKLPFAYTGSLSWLDAFFTATSAVTVTGLSTVNTADFSGFGQSVLMCLIQIGGLGFMTFAVVIAKGLGTKIGLFGNVVAQEALGETPFSLLIQTAVAVVKFALFFELIATVFICLRFSTEMPFEQALYSGLFYAISAFNNAGFALSDQSLMLYAQDVTINIVITALIILGGLGFMVLIDVKDQRKWGLFSLNTKLVLISTLCLNLIAFLFFYAIERNNSHTLGQFSEIGKGIAAWFQAITPRTAGFNTLDTASLTDASTFITLLLMFIGGGSLSTASGIKIGTFCIIIVATLAYLRKQANVSLFHYTLSDELIHKAFTVFFTSIAVILFSTLLLLLLEPQLPFLDVLFETVSALSTVGLSRGITGELSISGKILICLLMFIGRLGPLTIIYLIMQPRTPKLKYPKGNIQIG